MSEAEVMKRHVRRRIARVIMYCLLMATGIILTFSPSELVTAHVPGWVAFIWSTGLALSALGCLVGAFTDRWIGEYGFLPFMFTILIFYGAICVIYWSHIWPLMAFGFIILGFACSKIARWQDVRDIKLSSEEISRQDKR